jgi:hypothetical protein
VRLSAGQSCLLSDPENGNPTKKKKIEVKKLNHVGFVFLTLCGCISLWNARTLFEFKSINNHDASTLILADAKQCIAEPLFFSPILHPIPH